MPALEQNPAGAEGIVGVPQNLDDAAKRPTPLSELRHLGGLRRTLPLHLDHLSFQRNAEPSGPARPNPGMRSRVVEQRQRRQPTSPRSVLLIGDAPIAALFL